MPKRRAYLIIILIFILAFLAGNLSEPKYFNQGIDFLNSKLNLSLPYFWQLPFKLGLDLQGGVHLLYQADLSQIDPQERQSSLQGLRDVIERRVNLFGVQEPIVQVQGERLIVELAGIKDPAEAIRMIGETPYLEFREVFSEEEKQEVIKNIPEEQISEMMGRFKQETGREINREEILQVLTSNLFKSTELTGKYLKNAEVSFDPTTNRPQISLRFKEEGVKLFEEITERNVGKPLAIFLDGMSIVDTDGDEKITDNDLYAPIVQEKITGGEAVITGELNIVKAKEIVKRLNSGALPVKIGDPISQQSVGPTLGKISLEKSLKAGLLGFLAIILFMVLFYRLPGIIASLVLVIYLGFLLAIFKLIPVTLTLAGIGGFILSLGMAVDANVLIFARMREEWRAGKNFSQGLKEGFSRAWPAIRDGNLTTLIVAIILFFFGTSFIKGFALTLSLGILLSMFSAILITKNFLSLFFGTRFEKVKWLW